MGVFSFFVGTNGENNRVLADGDGAHRRTKRGPFARLLLERRRRRFLVEILLIDEDVVDAPDAAIVELVRHPSWMAGVQALVLLWLAILAFKTRIYSLKVQDRLIRLEERLRLQSVLPASMQPRIADLTVDQLIGLRFASDAELPGLVEKTLAGNWGRKQVKEAIVNWRPDTYRV